MECRDLLTKLLPFLNGKHPPGRTFSKPESYPPKHGFRGRVGPLPYLVGRLGPGIGIVACNAGDVISLDIYK